MSELVQIEEVLWEIPASARPDMRVPARVFADRELLEAIARDESLVQLQNVATLPGVVGAALAMPDIHQGYGFPVGGVAAMELPDGVVSPGGVGYDINCGVRLLALPVSEPELGARREALVHEISRTVPAGAGKESPLFHVDLDRVLREGSQAIGSGEDIERTESRGCLPGAPPLSPSVPRPAAAAKWGRWAPATTSSRCSTWTGSSTARPPASLAWPRSRSPCSSTRARGGSDTRFAPTTYATWMRLC
ncbi:MAG: hypothetical protein C4305_03595, partial [Thermoleophilia bacterium]